MAHQAAVPMEVSKKTERKVSSPPTLKFNGKAEALTSFSDAVLAAHYLSQNLTDDVKTAIAEHLKDSFEPDIKVSIVKHML